VRTIAVTDLLDLSFRQVDYLCRSGAIDPELVGGGQGCGSRRVWPPEVVARLEVALALWRACPTVDTGQPGGPVWTSLVRAVMDNPVDPPWAGWVVLDDLGQVHYGSDDAERGRILGRVDGALVARYVLRSPTAPAR
jgi:hypothetical protein